MQASAEKIWTAAQEQLRSMLSADTYRLWFAPLRASSQDNHSLLLDVSNDFCEVWLKDNYMGLLQDVVAMASGRQLQVKFRVNSAVAAPAPASAPAVHTTPAKTRSAEPAAERASANHDLGFNPKNTF